MTRKRLTEIDQATGIAIILVVIGHVVARQPPADNLWYTELKYFIYKFHMPFFMFLSGLIFGYSYDIVFSLHSYLKWAKKKILRLAPGFLLFGSLILVGKLIASQYVYVDNIPMHPWHGFFLLFFDPAKSSSSSLWYIYVLLELYLLFPLVLYIIDNNIFYVLVVGVVLHIIYLVAKLPEYLLINRLFEYSLYFTIGIYTIHHYDKIKGILLKYSYSFCLLFVISFFILFLPIGLLSKTIIGISSIPAILSLSLQYNHNQFSKHLMWVGSYTFSIYLMNTIFIGIIKGILLKLTPWDGVNFLFYFPILLLGGVYLPIFTHKILLSKVSIISRITR